MNDVTIVIPTHDRPEMLATCIDSIWAASQRVKEQVRILVVDDASTVPGTLKVAYDRGCDYILRGHNGGVGQTLAQGFQEVDSPFYAFWGDDDFMLPNWFELHLAKIHEGFDVVAGSYRMADADLNPGQEIILRPGTFEDLRRGDVQVNDGALVRRESLREIRFRPERERIMMMTFWLAMAAGGRRFGVVSEPTWLYRRHPNQLTWKVFAGPREKSLRRAARREYA